MTEQKTFVAVKPDGVERQLVGRVIDRFERKGLTLVGLKLTHCTREQAEQYYGEHKGKGFFEGLIAHITSSPLVAMVWRGPNAVALARNVIGATNPLNANQGTIRGDFGVDIGRNVVHGSDSPESAEREIAIFFSANEVMNDWQPTLKKWIVE